MRPKIASLLVVAPCALGCASAYEQTYDKELGRLRDQERQRQAEMEAAKHAEPQAFVAVVYYQCGKRNDPGRGLT